MEGYRQCRRRRDALDPNAAVLAIVGGLDVAAEIAAVHFRDLVAQ
jgi:hypothetical protein